MNHPLPPAPRAPAPIVRVLGLALRIRASSANVFRHAITLIVGWSYEEIAERNAAAAEAEAIDDPLETLRERLAHALRNDPPAVRREIMAAVEEVHRRTVRQAEALRITLPLGLEPGAPGR